MCAILSEVKPFKRMKTPTVEPGFHQTQPSVGMKRNASVWTWTGGSFEVGGGKTGLGG